MSRHPNHFKGAAPQPQPPKPPFPDQAELASRIEELRKAAQNLLVLYAPNAHAPSPAPPAQGEIRCCHFPPEAARRERELLNRYQAEDFRGLLAAAHMLLFGLVRVMKGAHPELRLRGRGSGQPGLPA